MIDRDFKEEVKRVLIDTAPLYARYFIDYEYLLCSSVFKKNPYYIISAYGDNFKHLSGVQSSLSSEVFYQKARNGSLTVNDFNFEKRDQSEKQVKGSVRKKIRVLPDIINIFSEGTLVEEDFVRNTVRCSFAAGTTTCTLGFTTTRITVPMSLLSGNKIDLSKAGMLDLILRRRKGGVKFDKIILGNNEMVLKYISTIAPLLSENLYIDNESCRGDILGD